MPGDAVDYVVLEAKPVLSVAHALDDRQRTGSAPVHFPHASVGSVQRAPCLSQRVPSSPPDVHRRRVTVASREGRRHPVFQLQKLRNQVVPGIYRLRHSGRHFVAVLLISRSARNEK